MMDVMHYEREFTILKADISKMLSLVSDSFEMSIQSLEFSDTTLAKRVFELDDDIDALNREIEEKVYEIIARYNPLTRDLRYVITMIKFANNLERIADLGCNMAEKALKIREKNIPFKLTKELKDMFGTALKMLHDTFLAFSKRDAELAKKIWKQDEELDNLELDIREFVISNICEEDFSKEVGTLYVLIARDLERIGDHLTNLCEEIIYIETGENTKDVFEV
ncbi:phosphate signaling complex protein PhoU [Thermosipho ferrireducens]|uniref:Phosphate-specific transport system accessory protein PhoU n=1 Tax=Thermosipho ferrireducens TaxID=2571116 RepID=A0ABX7SAD9_9BACT|nr:phosphate signaling complex protein PhoU [Thermosipho ferrireducens]QTA38963.1 phosphate signaling complex protein PhoU [Thermosipho ferrireducens]